jgi:hypothetical protein
MIASIRDRAARGFISSVTVQMDEGSNSTYAFLEEKDAKEFYEGQLKELKKSFKMVRNKDFEKPDSCHVVAPDNYPMIHMFHGDPIY